MNKKENHPESKQTAVHLNFMEKAKEATSNLFADSVLRCPMCNESYTHALRTYTLCSLGADEAGDILSFGCPFEGCDAEGFRRTALVILFSCESCPQPFELIFQQHKGATFIQTRVAASPIKASARDLFGG